MSLSFETFVHWWSFPGETNWSTVVTAELSLLLHIKGIYVFACAFGPDTLNRLQFSSTSIMKLW
jgi:hypothetical protein